MSAVSDTPDTGDSSRPLPGAPSRGGFRALFRDLWRRWNDAGIFTAPPRSAWPRALRRVRAIGFALLGVQLVVFCWWSLVLVHRDALTFDFSAYEQAAWLIGHGHLDPYSSVLRMQFWHNNSELILWPLAVLVRLSPNLVTFPWLQDLAIIGGEAIAFAWMCDVIAARHVQGRQSTSMSVALAALGIVLLIGNPWVIWATSFDVHIEAFIMLFALGAARDLHRGRRTVWIWVVLGLICGVVGATYMGAVGASAALSGRVRLRRGLTILLLGFGTFATLEATHAARTVGLIAYSSIVSGKENGVVPKISAGQIVTAGLEHPMRVVDAFWANRANIWANISPGGVLGLFWISLTAPILMLAAQTGPAEIFSLPGFQNMAVTVMVAVGTVALLATLASRPAWRAGRRKGVVPSLIGLMMINSLLWSILWLPQVSKNWLIVTPGASRVLNKLQKEIRPGDEVAASQGFVGAFSRRKWVYPLMRARTIVPVRARRVWIILGPSQGIENPNVAGQYADIARLTADPQMHLVAASNGIWAFEWTPPKGTKRLAVKGPAQATVPGWELAGQAGTPVRLGRRSRWYTTSNGKSGYVVDEGYWREPHGTYGADVTLSTTKPTNVELWDSTTSTLLARRVVSNSHGRQTIRLIGHLRTVPTQGVISGWSIWGMSPPVPPGNSLEVRVWTPGGNDHVNVYRVRVAPVS